MKTLRAIWRWIRKWWWAILGGLAAIGGIFFAILVASDSDQPESEPPKPKLKDRAEREVERIRLEGEVEKARVVATADSERADLDRIEQLGEEDPVEARRQLSTWLNSNL